CARYPYWGDYYERYFDLW
nr:immunoglobulin heavy chain junction region [Macaca mulatta]MOX39111.1 immunoglobulin heavy chain junction region [Macaca mulatta]MOX40550.1 immunoglobulin heavy chain junction region [Macaca mulatta]MOX40871.1 immunoglobulin heavy chain junction region [Macaca mulatta]MOX40878.1 immunoglobulin heavy chain junction region [Macaca mulatta]